MKKQLAALLAALLASAASAQSEDPRITDAKSKIAIKMKDPESVRFADVVASPKGGLVCGWINAKNSYGGYVGFKPFFVMGSIADVRDDDDKSIFSNRSTFAMMWRSCGLLPEGEKFGDTVMKVPKLNVQKECAKRRKQTDKPEIYADCEVAEPAAKAWLETHATGVFIAYKCEQDVRKFGSYSMGKSCVEAREANLFIDRGPRLGAATN